MAPRVLDPAAVLAAVALAGKSASTQIHSDAEQAICQGRAQGRDRPNPLFSYDYQAATAAGATRGWAGRGVWIFYDL